MPNDWRDANVSPVFKSGSRAVPRGPSCPEIPDIPISYCVSAWSAHYTKDKELLQRVQHRFTRMIKEVRDKD